MDFDGTLFGDGFPSTGEANMEVISRVKLFKKYNAECVLWTCRENSFLRKAVKICKEHGLLFDSVNENTPTQQAFQKEMKVQMAFRKIFADMYVDDKAIGSIEYFCTLTEEQIKKTL